MTPSAKDLWVPESAKQPTSPTSQRFLQTVAPFHPAVRAEAVRELQARKKALKKKQRSVRRQRQRLAQARQRSRGSN